MTKLNKIVISGFKSISNEHPVDLSIGDRTIIMGANGSGKSNIISFFKMLNFMMSGSFQSFVETNGGSQVFLHYGPKFTKSITGSLQFSDDKVENDYSFEISYAQGDNLVITSEKTWVKSPRYPKGSLKKLEVNFKESALVGKNSNPVISVLRKILSNCKVYQFHDSSRTSDMRNSSDVEMNNYLQAEANNLPAFLYRIKNEFPHDYEKIVEYVRTIVPQFKDFFLEPNVAGKILLKWVDTSASDYIFSPSQLSDGSMRFIALATLLLQPRSIMPQMIIIDEPELGLHPYAIDQLAEMIKEASCHSQIIVATQSPKLVDQFDASEIAIVETIETAGVNYTEVKRLNEDQLAEWLQEYTISELWEKNLIGGRPL